VHFNDTVVTEVAVLIFKCAVNVTLSCMNVYSLSVKTCFSTTFNVSFQDVGGYSKPVQLCELRACESLLKQVRYRCVG
jgi:hypothetical protein